VPKINKNYTDTKTQIIQINARIVSNKEIAPDYYKITIRVPEIIRQAKPGQFLHIRLADTYNPLLRRPFSIHRIKGKDIKILYEVVGKGTKILSEKKPGEFLDVIGPLGNGFVYRLPFTVYRSTILVAGGIGVAPLLFLAELLTTNYKLLTTVLIGAKTKDKILCEKEFKDLGCDVKISTDDGSKGFKGKVTDLLKDYLSTYLHQMRIHLRRKLINPITIFACGPKEMLKEIAKISKKYNISSFGSLEENLGCGIGVCLGCVIKTKSGYKRVCKDGPVFNLKEVVW